MTPDPAAAAPPRPGGVHDPESRRWVEALSGQGFARDEAVARLQALMLRATRFEVHRRVSPSAADAAARDDMAQQAADDAVVAVLARLGDFRGDSRFTTWAYKFALVQAAVAARRNAWHGRPLPEPGPHDLARRVAPSGSPHAAAVRHDLITALADAIDTALTAHQRDVFRALALNDVPLDVLAERLGSNRGALYKTLHVARRRLRDELARRGYTLDDAGTGS